MAKLGAGLLLVLLFVAVGDKALGAYVIRLKNGNEFVTSRYWQQGRQILFDSYGGVFGIDKGFVVRIEASNKPLTPLSTIIEESAVKRLTGLDSGGEESQKVQEEPAQESKVKRAADPIIQEFGTLQERFNNLDGMLTSELEDLSTDLMNFKRKIQTSGKSNDYLSEFTATFEMGNALEEALKARR